MPCFFEGARASFRWRRIPGWFVNPRENRYLKWLTKDGTIVGMWGTNPTISETLSEKER
jgi:hypothetical protein